MNRARSWSICKLGVALAAALFLAPAAAQSEPGTCDAVAGLFLATGELRDGDLPSRPVVYLERLGTPGDGRHHFSYAFNTKRGVAEVVMFNASGERLFDTASTALTCKAGMLVDERAISGGSEGCSREGTSRTTLEIGATGSLIFTTEVHIVYGLLCFKSPTNTRRTAEFLPFRAEAK